MNLRMLLTQRFRFHDEAKHRAKRRHGTLSSGVEITRARRAPLSAFGLRFRGPSFVHKHAFGSHLSATDMPYRYSVMPPSFALLTEPHVIVVTGSEGLEGSAIVRNRKDLPTMCSSDQFYTSDPPI